MAEWVITAKAGAAFDDFPASERQEDADHRKDRKLTRSTH